MKQVKGSCTVCGGTQFVESEVLWPSLIQEWQLSPHEVDYINRQQGCSCSDCGNNLRSQALAKAICETLGFEIPLASALNQQINEDLRVLEINPAGGLSKFLNHFPEHHLVEYPGYDMLDLAFESNSFDLVVHSDTLEHVSDPVRGLAECRRVLRKEGACVFTTPIVVDRFSRRRDGLPKSYHGESTLKSTDQIVHMEFGSDFWHFVIKAGFKQCSIHMLEWPSALAIVARG